MVVESFDGVAVESSIDGRAVPSAPYAPYGGTAPTAPVWLAILVPVVEANEEREGLGGDEEVLLGGIRLLNGVELLADVEILVDGGGGLVGMIELMEGASDLLVGVVKLLVDHVEVVDHAEVLGDVVGMLDHTALLDHGIELLDHNELVEHDALSDRDGVLDHEAALDQDGVLVQYEVLLVAAELLQHVTIGPADLPPAAPSAGDEVVGAVYVGKVVVAGAEPGMSSPI